MNNYVFLKLCKNMTNLYKEENIRAFEDIRNTPYGKTRTRTISLWFYNTSIIPVAQIHLFRISRLITQVFKNFL